MKAAFCRSSTCDPWWWPTENCGPGTQSLNEISGRRHDVESTMDIPREQDVQFKIFRPLIIRVSFLSLQVLLLFQFFPWTGYYISALVIKTLVLVFSGCDPHWPSAQNQDLIHTFSRSILLSPLPDHILNWDIIRILGEKSEFSKRPVVVQSLDHVQLLATPKWTTLH